jgi:hypothetical protein
MLKSILISIVMSSHSSPFLLSTEKETVIAWRKRELRRDSAEHCVAPPAPRRLGVEDAANTSVSAFLLAAWPVESEAQCQGPPLIVLQISREKFRFFFLGFDRASPHH